MKRFLVIIPIFLFIVLAACEGDGSVSSSIGTKVAQTQTATMWTPAPVTPTPTHIPNTSVIVNALNDVLRGGDPLGETLDTKFYVRDVEFDPSGDTAVKNKIKISVECDWVFKSSCTPERTFVVLMHVFEKEGVQKKIFGQVPTTLDTLQVIAFEHFNQIGSIEIGWKELVEFAKGEISGEQLGVHAKR